MATDDVIRKAARLRVRLQEAKNGNYYRSGWYAYMDRTDIEALIEHVLGPVPEPMITVSAHDDAGNLVWTRRMPAGRWTAGGAGYETPQGD